MEEWKIGEIKQINGEWYQCVECDSCGKCSLRTTECGSGTKSDLADEVFGECSKTRRSDSKHVIFKKLEKVGKPYMTGNKLIQRYKIYPTAYCINVYGWYYQNLDVKSWTVDIEIKQSKEDMEEKESNLKPFDIQKAREGKPVCTRDGRKARIICFDVKGDVCPIIALIEENGIETTYHYDKNGQNAYNKSELDLMMLSEKKEGWAVIKKSDIYETEEQAVDAMLNCRVGVMIRKITWEE